MVGELLHERLPLPRWGHYGHRECIAQPVAQSIHESLKLVKGGSVGFLQVESPCSPAASHLPPMGDASVPSPPPLLSRPYGCGAPTQPDSHALPHAKQ